MGIIFNCLLVESYVEILIKTNPRSYLICRNCAGVIVAKFKFWSCGNIGICGFNGGVNFFGAQNNTVVKLDVFLKRIECLSDLLIHGVGGEAHGSCLLRHRKLSGSRVKRNAIVVLLACSGSTLLYDLVNICFELIVIIGSGANRL